MKGIKTYFNTLLILMVFKPILVFIGLLLGIRGVFILSFLLAFLLLDILVIAVNLKYIKFKEIEVTLIILLLSTIIIGVINTPELSRRHLTDFLLPFIFILKIALLRQVFNREGLLMFFDSKFISRFVWWNFYASIIVIAMFYLARNFYKLYLGLTPEIYPFLINGLLLNNHIFIILSVLIIFLSGKRAMLLGFIVIFFIDRLRKLSNQIRLIGFSLVTFFILFSSIQFYDLNQFTAYRKYKWTIEKIIENPDNPQVLNVVSGGRFGEISAIYTTMEYYDFIFGKGVGYTYKWNLRDSWSDDKHGNAHFTPISIVSKYGLLFYALIVLYMTYLIFKTLSKRQNPLDIFCVLYIIGINIDFLFAYGFFTNKFFPIALSYLGRKRIELK